MKNTTISVPGQPFRTIQDGKAPGWMASCVDCRAEVPAQLGVLQPRCPACFEEHRRRLRAAVR